MAILCGVPVSEALIEHTTLALPHTYLVGGAPEAYKPAMQAAAKLREKLRTERTNLVYKIIEAWDEVSLVLQLLAGSDALYGYVGSEDYRLYPFVRPGAFVHRPRQKKFLPPVGTAIMIGRSSSWSSASITFALGPKYWTAG